MPLDPHYPGPRDRSNLRQFVENLRRANVSGVNNVVRTFQSRERLFAQQAVGVGDNAYSCHKLAISHVQLSSSGG